MLHTLDIAVGEQGSTVRRGFKWAELRSEDMIELCVCSPAQNDLTPPHTVVGTGQVTYVWVGRFIDVPASLLSYEHELRSREYNGLLASMRKAYGEGFLETEYVTVILYRRVS